MDKPKSVVKQYTVVIQEARLSGLISDDEVKVLIYLLAVLERPIVDIQREMEEQPRLRASVGYYFRMFGQLAKEQKDAVDQAWLGIYNNLHKVKYLGSPGKAPTAGKLADSVGKFTDKLVTAQALQDPTYAGMAQKSVRLEYMADQFGELRDAYNARTRFLEQFSNNSRFGLRQDKEEETS